MHQLQANEILLTQQNKLSQNTYISISISFFSIAQTHTVRPKAQGALHSHYIMCYSEALSSVHG